MKPRPSPARAAAGPRQKPRTFPLRAVAALFIERQHLDRPRATRLTARSLARFAEDTGGLQIDSINVVDRAHYLTAWSRFGVFDRAAFDRLAYRRRVLFEYFAHMACLVPVAHLPSWRSVMQHPGEGHYGWARWARRNTKLVNSVEQAVRERGPLANADFQHARPKGTSGWWNWKPANYALNYLWFTGRLAVHSRVHFQKRYDLMERVFPYAASLSTTAPEEYQRWHVRQSLHAMGAALETDLRLYLTYPRIAPPARKRALASLIASGEVAEIAVEGTPGRWLALTADLPALARAARRRAAARGTTLLSPFDSLLWHRDRVERLFGFNYRIEVYTPGHKRVHGYYSLPLFHDGQLIGRVDAKTHRAERRLEVRHVHFEPWFAKGAPPPAVSWGAVDLDGALAGLADSLHSLAAFVGADRVTLGRVTPARLKPALARLLRARPAVAARAGAAPDEDEAAEPSEEHALEGSVE